ncbi:hypothetical protein M758_5G143000 [Ceratodon purpureus]|uniref:Uncharacterized protein n=1 Tax=Ceratodon purpureus TaxID=3225 RepID=A0A8T0I461_CERPU|nr:hypothetical protein KC19_5G149200 [Ceratodon purpureus]KAG0616808.1 hypothetical protein M758_5G143000 [Ceratodon purpureus]
MTFNQIFVVLIAIVYQTLYQAIPSHVVSVEGKHNMRTVIVESLLATFWAPLEQNKV